MEDYFYQENKLENKLETYEPSGNYEIYSTFILLFFGAISALALGSIFGIITAMATFGLEFIVTIFYSIFMSIMAQKIGTKAKVRNKKLMHFFALIFSFSGIYIAWIVFIRYHSGVLIVSFSEVIKIIYNMSKSEQFNYFNSSTFSCLFWIFEFAFTWLFVEIASFGVAITPFCEDCKIFLKDKDEIFPLSSIENKEYFLKELNSKEFSILFSLAKMPPDAEIFTKYILSFCKSCENMYLLTIEDIKIKKVIENKEEKITEEKKILISDVIIDRSLYIEIKKELS